MSESDVLAQVESVLGWSLAPRARQFLADENYIQEVIDGERSINQLAASVRRFVRAWGDLPSPPTAGEMKPTRFRSGGHHEEATTLGDRMYALSEVFAAEANQDAGVVAFRQEVLGGQLLAYEEVEAWIDRQAEADGPVTRYLMNVPLPDGAAVDHDAAGVFTRDPLTISENGHRAEGVQIFTLDYQIPDSEWKHVRPTRLGGELESLRQLSEGLAKRYRWHAGQATVFVLTGITPLLTSCVEGAVLRFDRPVLSRITLSLDPVVSPKEVMDHYRNLRQRMLQGERYRTQDHKALRLAVFYAERPDGETWRERMAAWNDQYPDWPAKDEGQFGRDCRLAYQRLMDPGYQHPFLQGMKTKGVKNGEAR